MIEAPMIRKIRRIPIRAARISPSLVIWIFQIVTTASPGVNRILNTSVIIRRTTMDFRPLTINLKGTLESTIILIRNTVPSTYPQL